MIIKCTLKLSSLKKTRAEFGNDIVGYERAFLEDAYMKLKEIVAYSENDTTTYSPNLVSSGQKCKGSSADSSSQRSKYVSLGTKGITGQVFNMSFKNCGKIGATLDQVFSASMTVIEFLLQSDDFRNEYSSQHFETMKILWKTDQSGDFHVAGGLLFPILTLLLISYNSLEGIIACFESYGGKKRGVHHHWNFDQTSPIDIKNAISGLMKTEKCKIPFRMKKAFETIKDTWPLWTNNISLIWGIGCDAKGSNISDDDPSYLVCEPVRISEVDEFRNGATDKVFVNPSVNDSSLNLSAVTRLAARTDSKTDNSDSDSDSDKKPIRNRYYSLY